LCGFQRGKPHEARQRHRTPQEIRGSEAEGPAVRLSPTQLRKCVFSVTQGSLTIGIQTTFFKLHSEAEGPAYEFPFPDSHSLLNAPACPLTGSDAGKGSCFMRANAAGDGSLRQISQL